MWLVRYVAHNPIKCATKIEDRNCSKNGRREAGVPTTEHVIMKEKAMENGCTTPVDKNSARGEMPVRLTCFSDSVTHNRFTNTAKTCTKESQLGCSGSSLKRP